MRFKNRFYVRRFLEIKKMYNTAVLYKTNTLYVILRGLIGLKFWGESDLDLFWARVRLALIRVDSF